MKGKNLKIPILLGGGFILIAGLILTSPILGKTAAKAEPIIKLDNPASVINVAGIWDSNAGWKYNIKQKGNQFSWTVINRTQKAIGSIDEDNKNLEVTWDDNGSKGTTTGLILEVDPAGNATFIEWDNGDFFHRKIKKKS